MKEILLLLYNPPVEDDAPLILTLVKRRTSMLTLTLYTNLNPNFPIKFYGKNAVLVRHNLRTWLNLNRGDNADDPSAADGICVFLEPDNREYIDSPVISLTFDESDTPGWNVQNRHDLNDAMWWEEARDAFISLAMIYGEWLRAGKSYQWGLR